MQRVCSTSISCSNAEMQRAKAPDLASWLIPLQFSIVVAFSKTGRGERRPRGVPAFRRSSLENGEASQLLFG